MIDGSCYSFHELHSILMLGRSTLNIKDGNLGFTCNHLPTLLKEGIALPIGGLSAIINTCPCTMENWLSVLISHL